MSGNLSFNSITGPRPRAELNRAILLGLIICLAFSLRLFRLDHQELRGDEAFDALFATQQVKVILNELQTAQPYPPLFHIGLHFWLDLVGQSEIMQRFLALISGVLLVPLVYQLARLTLGQTTGLIAAGLAAVNPFYIWHAQDGRMYSLLAMLSTASIWLGLLLLQERSTFRTGLTYWAVTVLALLTHYFAWWLLLAENAAALLIIWKQGQRRAHLGRWLKWQIAIVLTLLPWLIFALGLLTSHTSGWIPPLTPPEMLKRSLMAFSLGSTMEPALRLGFSLAMGALFLLGCLFRSQPVQADFRGSGRSLLLIFAGVPLLATMLLSLLRPAFDEKYLIAVVACYLILVAHGIHFLGAKKRWLGIVASMVIVVASGWSLFNYYSDPDYAKSPSWRDLVASIEARAAEGDVIVQNYPDPGFAYYYHGELPVQLLPAAVPAPQERTDRALQRLATAYRRVWLIPGRSSAWDAEGFVQQWLTRYGDLVDERDIGSLQLQLYQTPQTYQAQMQPVGARLGGQLELVGYRLTPEAQKAVAPGERLSLTLYWQALAAVEGNYTVFVHLADAGEKIWGQHDGQPVEGTYPTGEWIPGQVVVDRRTIEISPEAPVGPYRLMAGMYDGATGQRLVVTGTADAVADDRLVLTVVEVAIPGKGESEDKGQGPSIINALRKVRRNE